MTSATEELGEILSQDAQGRVLGYGSCLHRLEALRSLMHGILRGTATGRFYRCPVSYPCRPDKTRRRISPY
jgi:hypothetical protein